MLKKIGHGIDQKAVEALKSWRFQPANGPDGYPVAAVVPIEVSFHTNYTARVATTGAT